jgi:hypothetical protein
MCGQEGIKMVKAIPIWNLRPLSHMIPACWGWYGVMATESVRDTTGDFRGDHSF